MRKSRRPKQKREVQQSQDAQPKLNPYIKELEVPLRTKLVTSLLVCILVLVTAIVFYSTDMINKQSTKNRLTKLAKEADRNYMEELRIANEIKINELKGKADSSYQVSDYFAAVFFYRRILMINQSDIEVHQKLIESLKASCANGHDLHCDAVEKAEKRLEFVESE